MQKSIFSQKIQKSLCITTKSLYTNSKFQTQLSRKLQRFRTCRKNKKCSIFHDLSEYIIFSYGCKLLDWSFKCYRKNTIAQHPPISFSSFSDRKIIFFSTFNIIFLTQRKFEFKLALNLSSYSMD